MVKKVVIPLLLIILSNSCSKVNPISGIYQTEDHKLSAIIIDSTMNLMIGNDTMITYELNTDFTFQDNKNTLRNFKVSFSSSLTQNGYEHFELPIHIEQNQTYGGTLTALFKNNEVFFFGGYSFIRLSNEQITEVFNSWKRLILGNGDYKLLQTYMNDK